MSLQAAKSNAFLTMLALRNAKRKVSNARILADDRARHSKEREEVVVSALDAGYRPGERYLEEIAAEAWDAHREAQDAKATVEGLKYDAHKLFAEHQSACAALVHAESDAERPIIYANEG